MGRRGRRRKELLDVFKETRGYCKLREGSTRSYCVENSLWKRLWTCRKADWGMNESCGNKMGEIGWIQLAKDGDKLRTFVNMVMSIQVVIIFWFAVYWSILCRHTLRGFSVSKVGSWLLAPFCLSARACAV
jgi:hypothetical protein